MSEDDRCMLPVLRASELEDQSPDERWLIEGLWARSAIGLIGGAPKCCKTWLGLDMAVSVASGTPALGRFPVEKRGPVLVYLAEDALPQVRCRIDALCRHRGINIDGLDLHVITASVLRLDLLADQERLAATLAALRPCLLVLDPLVRMHRLDENSATEISGLLGYIRDLQRRFDTAIALVHHASKKQRAHPGQALRGSSDLHAIGDCNAYLARKDERIVLTLEQRAARAPDPMTLELAVDGEGHACLQVSASDRGESAPMNLEDQVIGLLAHADLGMPRSAIRARLRVNNQRLGNTLTHLERGGRIRRDCGGWQMTRLPGETEAGPAGTQPAEG